MTGPHLRATQTRRAQARDADRAPLEAALADLPAGDVPCRSGELPASIWTSEDAAVQRAAALACLECPALAECRDYAIRHPREAGTYGALTERDRSGRALSKLRKTQREDNAS